MKGSMSERGGGVWRLRVADRVHPDGKPVQRSKTVKGNRREALKAWPLRQCALIT
jgi:hypothetical protein